MNTIHVLLQYFFCCNHGRGDKLCFHLLLCQFVTYGWTFTCYIKENCEKKVIDVIFSSNGVLQEVKSRENVEN